MNAVLTKLDTKMASLLQGLSWQDGRHGKPEHLKDLDVVFDTVSTGLRKWNIIMTPLPAISYHRKNPFYEFTMELQHPTFRGSIRMAYNLFDEYIKNRTIKAILRVNVDSDKWPVINSIPTASGDDLLRLASSSLITLVVRCIEAPRFGRTIREEMDLPHMMDAWSETLMSREQSEPVEHLQLIWNAIRKTAKDFYVEASPSQVQSRFRDMDGTDMYFLLVVDLRCEVFRASVVIRYDEYFTEQQHARGIGCRVIAVNQPGFDEWKMDNKLAYIDVLNIRVSDDQAIDDGTFDDEPTRDSKTFWYELHDEVHKQALSQQVAMVNQAAAKIISKLRRDLLINKLHHVNRELKGNASDPVMIGVYEQTSKELADEAATLYGTSGMDQVVLKLLQRGTYTATGR